MERSLIVAVGLMDTWPSLKNPSRDITEAAKNAAIFQMDR